MKTVFIILIALLLGTVSARSKSKFDYGVGMLNFRLNHYRGSDQFKNYFLPLPYLRYESKYLEAEQSNARGNIFDIGPLALKASLIFNTSVDSDDNEARRGMPDLGYTFEFGPFWVLDIWKSQSNLFELLLETPTRAVYATDLKSVDHIGYTVIPYINFIIKPSEGSWGWGSEFSIAPYMIASKQLHSYYYQVKPQYVSSSRPIYNPKGGYSGSHLIWILNKRVGRMLFTPFMRYDILNNAKFVDSPLVKKRDYLLFGLSLFWLFSEK